MLRDLLVALRFLTVLPVPMPKQPGAEALARSMFFFSAVGLLIGVLSYGLFLCCRSFLPERVATLALLVAPIFLSGGLHVDGFADSCDGFFGGKDRAEILRIMKEPQIGVWGAVGVALLLLVKFELLQTLPNKAGFYLLALTAGRWAQVILGVSLPYAGSPGGLGECVAKKVGVREVLGATAFLLPVVFWLRIPGAWALATLGIFLALFSFYVRKKIGGITGDVIGASSEMTELFIFLFAAGTVRFFA